MVKRIFFSVNSEVFLMNVTEFQVTPVVMTPRWCPIYLVGRESQ